MKRIISLVLCAILCLSFVSCDKQQDEKSNIKTTTTTTTAPNDPFPIAQIVMENGDAIVLQLDADSAPRTVANFISLANEGYYNGVAFSALASGNGILSGEIDAKLTNIFGEFAANSYSFNTNSHTRGAISMYRPDATDFNSASSQFFICNSDMTEFDGQFAVFGYVISGLDVLDNVTKNVNSSEYNVIKKINIISQSDEEILHYAQTTTTRATRTTSSNVFANPAGIVPDKYIEGVKVDAKHPIVCITVKNVGDITLQLDGTQAPITVANFISLIEDGFYNGLTFHRIIDGFMIQGGDPQGTGMGGSDTTIKGEFSANGVDNTISHTRGVISMARSQDMDSASSQFFICDADAPHLDGQYAAFGYVLKGMNVVDYIADNAVVQDANGTVLSENQPVIEKIEVVKK